MIDEEMLMKKSKYSDAQIMGILKQAEGGVDLSRFRAAPIAHLCSLCFEGQGAFPAEC